MPRRSIPFLPDQYYHFYNRGNNRQAVFFERENYLYFLKGIKKYMREHVDILVYSLMPTHYHILGRVRSRQTSEFLKNSEVSGTVSKAMMRLGVSYTKAINKRFNRVGALFQGQFQGKPIQHYNHLLNLCVYIHANPVKDGLVALPENWEFSNYLEWMNLREGTLVNREFIEDNRPLAKVCFVISSRRRPRRRGRRREHLCKMSNFGTPEEYKKLVMEYIKTRILPKDVRKYLQDLED